MFIQKFEEDDRKRRLEHARRLMREIEAAGAIRPPIKLASSAQVIAPASPSSPALPPPNTDERGVYEEDMVPPGERWFKVRMSNGKLGRVQFPEELCDEALIENLWRRLDVKDPVAEKGPPPLRIL